MRIARITEDDLGDFGLEYDNGIGKKNTMRLDAHSYDRALREAKSFLGVNAKGHDNEGVEWDIE